MNYRHSQFWQFISFFARLRFNLMLAIVCLATVGSISAAPSDSDSGSPQTTPENTSFNKIVSPGLTPWTVISPAPTPVSRPAGAFANGRFYVIGGEQSGGAASGIVQIYDPQTDAWDDTSADPMPTPGWNLCAATVDGLIYVPGGYDGGSAFTDLQILDPATGTWTTAVADPVPAPAFNSACTEHDGRLYLFGGTPGGTNNITDSTWVFDPQQSAGNRWSALSSSPFTHAYGSAVAANNGLIFVTGFRNTTPDLDTVAAYNPATDSWIAYPALQNARAGAAAWIRDNRLYVGGGGWSSYLNSVERYNLNQGTAGSWEFTEPLNAGRRTFAHAMDPVTGQMFAAAGWAGAFLDSAETVAGRHVRLSPIPTLSTWTLLMLVLGLFAMAGFRLPNRHRS
ncbi:Kelch repeat-containing protein [Halopseudomonas salegens]|uniref:Kelch motif-containing protein n=1 Tax=Halopseudomonas salegens TaxID=1434072 RepID=A0A1H2HYF6_9GAMM|nr:kelch repeat-containing protein [Halopseudomonas salegens]SDU36746.1 Kelch motif-containing protein [Halopseudomonas salegens]